MIFFIEIFLLAVISISLTFLCKKKVFLLHNTGESHQSFIKSESTPLVGGIIIFFSFLINYQNISYFYIFLFFILVIGILSDSKKIKSAYFRLLAQFLIVLICIFFYDLKVETTRILILDNLLENNLTSVFFTVFCVLIIVNGSNFIDGSNLLAIGYFIILELTFIFLKDKGIVPNIDIFLNNLIFVLLLIFLLNLMNKLYLGDAGSYLLGFIYAFKCISLSISNPDISPFFIVLILWYPAFEILFSILRKLNFNRSPIKPDSNHLHQLVYFFLLKKIKSDVLRTNLVGVILNLYNLIFISLSLIDIYHTQYQIILFIANLSIYVFVYIRLLKIKLKNVF